MSAPRSFADEIRAFMTRWGHSPSQIGREAMRDPNFVGDVLDGKRSPTERSMTKIRDWMLAQVRSGAARRAAARRSAEIAPTELYSIAQLRKMGLSPKPGETPIRSGGREFYRLNQARKHSGKPPPRARGRDDQVGA